MTSAPFNTLRRSVLKNGGWAISVQGANAVAALVETVLLARYLSLDTFGALIVLTSAVDFVFGLLDFRTGQAVIKFTPELGRGANGGVAGFLKMMLLIDVSIAAVGLVGITLFGSGIAHIANLSDGFRNLMIALALGGALKSLVRSAGSYLRVSGAFATASTLSIVSALARIAIISAILLSSPSLASVVYGILASDALFFILMAVASFIVSVRYAQSPLTARLSAVGEERGRIWSFLFSTNIESTVKTVSGKVDVLLLAVITTPAAVAIYKVATRIAGTLLLFSDPLLMAIYPEMSRADADGRMAEMNRILRGITRWLVIIGAAGIGAFALYGRGLLEWLAGADYAAAHPAALIMAAGTSLAMIFFWARPMLLVRSRSSALVGVAAASAATQFLLFALFAPSLGAIGGAIGYGAFFATSALGCLWLLRRDHAAGSGYADPVGAPNREAI